MSTLSSRARAKFIEGEADECWPWTGATSRGYGIIFATWSPRVRRMAHRVVYEMLVGPIPDGLVLDHRCHDDTSCAGGATCLHKRCVNPAHLAPVTNGENIRRSTINAWALKARWTHCVHGHEFTEANTLTSSGRRRCRICRSDQKKAAGARRRLAQQVSS